MSTSADSPELSSSGALATRLKASIGKVIIINRATRPNHTKYNPHWRKSSNVLVSNVRRYGSTISGQSQVQGIFVTLPTELRQAVEDHLALVDLICLQQTCRRFRYDTQAQREARDLDYMQLYSLRKRLDQDTHGRLCSLERGGHLGRKLAVCSFCHYVHARKHFTPQQLRIGPQIRVCSPALQRYLVLGYHWTHPSVLRQVVDERVTKGYFQRFSHTMPLEVTSSAESQRQQILSRVIECDKSTPAFRTCLFVDETGLVLEHDFYLQSQDPRSLYGWNIPLILDNPYKSVLAVCPHSSLRMAALRLEVANEYNGQCNKDGCRTRFGWFERSTGGDGEWYDLCFRVKRKFGWIENLMDRFWQGQAA